MRDAPSYENGLGKNNSSRISKESEIFETFATIVREKFADAGNIERLDALYKSPEYSKEKATLTDINNNGMVWGLGAGLGTFIVLRKGPSALSRFLLSRRGASMGGTRHGYNFNASTSQSPFEHGGSDQPRKPGIFLRAVKFGLDLFVSTSIAMYSSVFFADKKKLLQDISDVPLVEGRSLIADEFCTEFMTAYKEIPRETWSKYRGTNEVTDAIEKFVLNCKRREVFEAQLKAERGLKPGGTGDHLSLPTPGVPRISDVGVDDISGRPSIESYDSSANDNFASKNDVGDEDDVISDWHSFDDFEGKGGK